VAALALPAQIRSLPYPARPPVRALFEIGVPRQLLWSSYTLPIPNLPPGLNGLRVLHLSDIHLTPRWMPALDILHQRVVASPPDLICITGDFVDAKHDTAPSIANVIRFISGLKSRLGIYGTIGNHDGDTLPVFLPRDLPVRFLYNESVTLRDGDSSVEVIGLHGVEPGDASDAVLANISPKPANTLRLVLAHYPSQAVRIGNGKADVVMAGHTHGGQVCLPGGWPILTHDALPRRLAKGVHQLDDRWLVVSRGIGFSTYRIRTFCPSEAIELTLVSAS
jgi:predicted MPP superfamily phosphohydrolase